MTYSMLSGIQQYLVGLEFNISIQCHQILAHNNRFLLLIQFLIQFIAKFQDFLDQYIYKCCKSV